jgi:hypothetical protein
MAPKFGDLGKDAGDLVGDDFSTKNSFEFKTTAADGTQFTHKLEKSGDSLSGNFTAKFSPLTGVKATLKATSGNQLTTDLAYDVSSNIQLKSKVTALPALGVTAGCDYDQENVNVTGNLNLFTHSLDFTATTGANSCNFWAGVSGGFSAGDKSFSGIKGALEYRGNGYTATLTSDAAMTKPAAQYFQKVNKSTAVAGSISMQGSGIGSIVFALSKAVNGGTRKFKVEKDNDNWNVGVSYGTKVADGTALNLAASFNPSTLADPKVGVSVNMS